MDDQQTWTDTVIVISAMQKGQIQRNCKRLKCDNSEGM